MKKKSPEPPSSPERSFHVALEQMATILRKEVKLKDRKTQVLSPSSPSLNNFVEQVALILRQQARKVKPNQKRSWKK